MRSRSDNSILIRKRIESHVFANEEGEEYEGSAFGGFSDYFRRKRMKLQNRDTELRTNSLNKPQIFRGVVAHVNGYTQPSLNDLHDMIVSHGGIFLQYLDGKSVVTHIIAASLTPKKAIEFRKYRIVKPAWIVDSIEAGKLIPWDKYRVIDEGPGQQLLKIEGRKVTSRINDKTTGYSDQTRTSWYNRQIKKFADDIDHDDSSRSLGTLDIKNKNHGSQVIEISDRVKSNPQEGFDQFSEELEDDLSSESFEVTSSLEDVLDNAKASKFHPAKKENSCGPHEDKIGETISSPKEGLARHQEKQANNISVSNNSFTSKIIPSSKFRPLETDIKSSEKTHETVTAEEYNAFLLADPKIRKSTPANPNFINQYYSESRLHHLSVWKAELKSRLQKMAVNKSNSQKQSVKLKLGTRRYILHVDFDCFFCAVSLKGFPEFIDKPAVVAHSSKSGSEIACCNYIARAFGVKNGMWMKNALQLCPQLKVLPYDFPAYEETSNIFYQAILDIGGIVQSVSVDEALIDITSLCQDTSELQCIDTCEDNAQYQKANIVATNLRSRIKKETGCEVSVGIGNNILLAKLALRKAKPAGQYQLRPEQVLDFIGELNVEDLPGVAHSIGGKLRIVGANLVKDVRQLTKNRLTMVLGQKIGEKIWEYSHGIDHTEVGEQIVRKSVSAEVNWGIRFISQAEAEEFVQNLCIELQRRLLNQMVQGRQLTVKIMRKSPGSPHEPVKHLGHGICDKFNKSIVLGVATNDAEILGRESVSILRSYGFPAGELRGLGVQMTKLEPWRPTHTTTLNGGQRRIDFEMPVISKSVKSCPDDHIFEYQTDERKQIIPAKFEAHSVKSLDDACDDLSDPPRSKAGSRFLCQNDPIRDDGPIQINSPIHPAAAITKANAADIVATKPLNVTGTQFIIPTQMDSSVLETLPQDIRTKLMEQSKLKFASRTETTVRKPETHNPTLKDLEPTPSQLDPEILAALPEDVKAEVLARYKVTAGPHPAPANFLNPSRNARHLSKPTKKASTVRKRGRIHTLGFKAKQDPQQSNLVARVSLPRDQTPEEPLSADLDPDFLSALPEDMREEVLAEHRRQQQTVKYAMLMTAVTVNKKRRAESLPIQRKIVLPAREPRPTFTTRDLSSVTQLRETTSAWFKEFSDNGPHPEDVAALGRYLRRVVLDERDLAKVVSIIKWLGWLIEESSGNASGTDLWIIAFEKIKDIVQLAVHDRGLGRLDI